MRQHLTVLLRCAQEREAQLDSIKTLARRCQSWEARLSRTYCSGLPARSCDAFGSVDGDGFVNNFVPRSSDLDACQVR